MAILRVTAPLLAAVRRARVPALGGTKGAGFEGGQTPLAMRLPKLPGFRNPRRIEYTAVNVERLERKFEDGAVIDGAALKAARITKSEFEPVKVLGNGELTKKFTVKVDKVSASAQAKIEAAGRKGQSCRAKWS